MTICLEPMSQRELGYARPDVNAPIASDEWRPQLSPVLGPFLGEDHLTNLFAIAAADFLRRN